MSKGWQIPAPPLSVLAQERPELWDRERGPRPGRGLEAARKAYLIHGWEARRPVVDFL